MADPLSVIGTVIGLLAAAEAAYDKIKAIKGLPKAFSEVSLRLPIAQEILRKIDEKYENLSVATAKTIAPTVESCRKNAEALKVILEMLPPRKDATSHWESIVKHYISIIKIRGQKERVETLTESILKDIQLLANHETIREAADQPQLRKLEEAIKAIEKVEASISDESLEDNGGVSITHGGNGPQNFQVGDNNKQFSHFGSGNVIETANYGPTSGQRKADALTRLNGPSCKEHKNRNPKATANTCKWFTEHPKFNDWINDCHLPLLWISADPGCGKSVLARHLIDKVLPSLCQSSRIIYFFFKDGSEDQDNAGKAVKGLLDQLLRNDSPLFTESILESLEELGESKLNSFAELWNILKLVLSHQKAEDIICVLDALDECNDGLSDLANALGDFNENNTTSTRFLLLSRPYRKIQDKIVHDNVSVIHLRGENAVEVDKIATEINLVIKEKVSKLNLSPRDKERVYEEISRMKNRTYLWAHLICDMLAEVDFVTSDLHEHLRRLPPTVEEMYERILDRSSNKAKAKVLLHIVVVAARPFSLEEMARAMAVESCTSSDEKPPVMETAVFQTSIRNICGLFLVIKDGKVYLIHQTAREFLIRETSRCSRAVAGFGRVLKWKGCLDLEESNKIMANICIRYLVYIGDHDPPAPAENEYETIKTPPLFDYAATYWISHYQSWNLGRSSECIRDILRLCDPNWHNCITWQRIFVWNNRKASWLEDAYNHDGSCDMTSLDLVSFLGLEAPFKTLLEEGTHDLLDSDVLCYAVESGNRDLVKIILNKMVGQPNFFSRRKSFNITRPLMCAVDIGHEAILETLMSFKRAEIDPSYERVLSTPDRQTSRSTGLSSTTKLSKGLEIPRRRKRSRSTRLNPDDSLPEREALSRAARKGQLAIVRKLLEDFKVDPAYVQDIWGYTAFSNAAAGGHVDVVNFLLQDGRVNPDMKDSSDRLSQHSEGQTPLSLAAEHGHLDVVEILLGSGQVYPDSRDEFGRTPLSHAAEAGHLNIVKVLLKIDGVEINPKDASGTTPLGYASSNGHYGIVKTFLDTGNADEESKSQSLTLAVDKGHEDIIGLLFSFDSFEAKLKDGRKMSLISLAVGTYYLPVLRLLQERWNTDLGLTRRRRILNGSPIAQAMKSTEDVFEYIFDAGRLDVNFEYSWESENGNIHYSTLLRRAAKEGQYRIVEVLLSRKADVNLRSGRKGETALYTGVKCGHWMVVDTLLQAEGIDVSLGCKKGFTPRLIAKKRITRHQLSPGYTRHTFERILDRLNEHILAMPDYGEALETLERTRCFGKPMVRSKDRDR